MLKAKISENYKENGRQIMAEKIRPWQ